MQSLRIKNLRDNKLKVIIDHKEKTVQPYDLKCVWNVEGFFRDYFLYRRSYFQAYLYKQAGYKMVERMGLIGYIVGNPMFIVSDSINYYNPLIYTLSDKNMEDAYNGFTYDNRYYPGVKETINDLKFALENNLWTISKKNYLLKGIVPIDLEI